MSNDYFNHTANRIALGVKARSAQLNSIYDEIANGFDLLPNTEQLLRASVDMTTDAGAANAYVVTFTAPLVPTAYTDGMRVAMRPVNTNTGASTLNVNALGAKSIKRADGLALIAGVIVAGEICELRYDKTAGYFRMIANTRFYVRNAAGSLVLMGG